MTYTVVITPEEGGYSVSVPALPGCYTEGDTLEQAIASAKEVIALYLESLRERGEEIPVEQEQPRTVLVNVA